MSQDRALQPKETTESKKSFFECLPYISEFLKSLSMLAWPVIFLFVLVALMEPMKAVIESRKLSIRVGDYELNIQDATRQQDQIIEDIRQDVNRLFDHLNLQDSGEADEPDGTLTRDRLKSVLWVEDTPQNSAYLIEAIRSKGVEVAIARSTREAVKALKASEFSAIVTDMGRMEPDSSEKNPTAGLELVEAARKLNPDIPILVYTSREGPLLKAATMLGANAVTGSDTEVLRKLGI